jgi:DNA-directed RNA polymerase specialized sigma24 family protein
MRRGSGSDDYDRACRAVRRAMPRSLWGRFDAEDFVQDAAAALLGKPETLARHGPGILARMAKCRMIDAARAPTASRESPLGIDPAADRPTAAQESEGVELWALMLDAARSDRERGWLELRWDGWSTAEIAGLAGVTIRTVERCFGRLKARLG